MSGVRQCAVWSPTAIELPPLTRTPHGLVRRWNTPAEPIPLVVRKHDPERVELTTLQLRPWWTLAYVIVVLAASLIVLAVLRM